MNETAKSVARFLTKRIPYSVTLRVFAIALGFSSSLTVAICRAGTPDSFEGVKALTQKTETGAAYRLYRDVIYQGAEGERNADVYVPISDKNSPRGSLLLIHGGGWAGGDKSSGRQVELARFAVDEGLVAVSINYSLTKFSGGNPRGNKLRAGWPGNIYDCKSALRWMKTHSGTLGIDPSRIGVAGGSAGGHLALLLGLSSESRPLNEAGAYLTQNNKVRCIIDFYGIPDVRKFEVYSLLSERDRYDEEIQALASPIEHLTKDSPPILIFHGTGDTDVEPVLSEIFVAKAKEMGAHCEYIPLEGAGHGFGLRAGGEDLRPLIRKFLGRHL